MTDIRKKLRAARKSLTSTYKKEASISIASEENFNLFLQEHQNVRRIGIYLALQEEININALIEKLWKKNIHTYCPLLHPVRPRHLFFIEYSSSSFLVKDRYGITTPKFDPNKILAPWELDAVLTPLVGFDENGNRIGMGAGFYDSSFAYRTIFKDETPMIGCAYDCQKLEHINVNIWDQPLDGILTESGYIKTNLRR